MNYELKTNNHERNEWKNGEPLVIPSGSYRMTITSVSDSNLAALGVRQGSVFYRTNETVDNLFYDTYYKTSFTIGIPQVGGRVFCDSPGLTGTITNVEDLGNGRYSVTVPGYFVEPMEFEVYNLENRKWWTDGNIRAHSCVAGTFDLDPSHLCFFEVKGNLIASIGFSSEKDNPPVPISSEVVLPQYSWQPIVTSPSVS